MLLEQERRDASRTARRLAAEGLAHGGSGTVSVRSGDLIAVTPAGVPLDRVEPTDCPVLSLEGGVLDGRRSPAADTTLHIAVHRCTPVGALVQAPGEHAAAVSAVLSELPPVHQAAARLGGAVPVAGYAPYGSGDLADRAVKAFKGRSAALLACLGGAATGEDADRAYENMRLLEWLCGVYTRSRALGAPRVLSEDELAEVRRRDEQGWAGPDPFLPC